MTNEDHDPNSLRGRPLGHGQGDAERRTTRRDRGARRDGTRHHPGARPNGGLQPQAAADAKGVVHLIYLAGDSVAADVKGHVYVAWHAPEQKGGAEAGRRVWVAVSHDAGATFAPEVPLSEAPTEACGCCGMDVLAGADGRHYALYRAATEHVNRDIYLASLGTADEKVRIAHSQKVAPTKADVCMMSTAALVQGPHGVVGAWETKNQVQWGVIDPGTGQIADPTAAPGRNGKHPAVDVNAKGETLIAWAEGTGWNRGGSVAWQVYDAQGKPIDGASGKKECLPAWGKPAAFAKADGSFVVLY